MTVGADDTQRRAADSSSRRLARLEEAHNKIVRCVADLESAPSRETTLACVDRLLEILPEHFTVDEEGPDGIFEEIRAIQPSLDTPLKSLQQEHQEIIKTLEALQERLREADRDFEPLREQRAACVRKIHDHERRESRLVMDTYFLDDGGSG